MAPKGFCWSSVSNMGRQPLQNIGLRTEDGWDISGEDVQIWLEEQGENSFAISAYCEKLLPMLREEEGRAWWMPVSYTHLHAVTIYGSLKKGLKTANIEG